MSAERRHRLAVAARWIVSIAALLLVIRYIGFQELYEQILTLDLAPLTLVVALLLLEAFMRCLNWQQLARTAGSSGRLRDFLHGYFTGGFVATLLPSTLGTDAARSFFIARRTGSKTEVMLAAAFAVNFLSLVALSLCALAAGIFVHVQGERLSYSSYGSLAIAAASVAVACCVLVALRVRGGRKLDNEATENSAPPRLLSRLRRVLERFVATLIQAGSGSGGELTRTLAIATLTCVIRLVGWTALLVAVGAQFSWAALFVLGPAMLVLAALPISIGGFGGLQAASVLLLAGWGVAPEEAAAWSLLQSSLYVFLNVPGAIPFLTGAASYKPFRVTP